VNLVLDAQGPSGGLAMASGSVDQKNTYVFGAIPHGIQESVAKNISYWSTSNGDDTMVTLWNPADEAQDLLFTLFFSGGHYGFSIPLRPRATHMFSVSEIIRNQIPDAEGNIIPATVHEGSAKISGPKARMNTFSLPWMWPCTTSRRRLAATFVRPVTAWSMFPSMPNPGQHLSAVLGS